jgi:Cd2+/Zn2+-exporting ATPase
MLFYQIGELFQSYAVGKSRKNITALMDIRPDYANIEVDGKLTQVDPDEVEIGSVIVVQPGEKVPLDGVVTEGTSSLNTSALTGESVPRNVSTGDEIISGCVNLSGVLKVRTTKGFGESTVSKILDLVENSSMKKSKSENFISKFARYYTPGVCYSALALAILPPLFQLVMGNPAEFTKWIGRALTFLVISCPCALVISIPLSFFGGIGGASARGILVKGSSYLEILSKSKYIVFDKTGTLTEGVFKVTEICPENMEKEELLRYAAYAESFSTHPISKSLREAYGQEIDNSKVENVQEISGHGVCAEVDGHKVYAGNAKLMASIQLKPAEPQSVGTIIHISVDNRYNGYILISDVIKANSKAAIAGLKEAGVKKIVMLTGDAKRVAESVAAELKVDEVHSELLPGDKVDQIEALLAEKLPDEKLAFVGDGINDAPVLSRADIGVAMGAMGSDAAIEAADIVLMDDDPAKIALAMKISQKTLRIVYENIVFALGVKFICLILGAFGVVNMWMAIFADVGVMVIAVLNATRALKTKNL